MDLLKIYNSAERSFLPITEINKAYFVTHDTGF